MRGPIVTVAQGKLRGVIEESVLGSSYLAFKGIPFAIPPVGKLRFQDPKPVQPWSGVKDATESFECCIQRTAYPPFSLRGTEDCLYLNVFTNSVTGRKPVMFWVHGGAFNSGTGSDTVFRPDYLITKDIVLVSTNYRLGALGFLTLGHKMAPGNQGLKDVILALKWVKENAASFGGDPNNITIFGVSAGAAICDVLCRSPAAKGLIQKAILQSGCLRCMWAVSQRAAQKGFKLASLLGMDSNNPVEVIEFLQNVPASEIIDATPNVLESEYRWMHELAFGITIDVHSENPVLPVPVEELSECDSEISLLVGYTSHEFVMFLTDIRDENLPKLESHLTKRLAYLARLEDISNIDQFLKNVRDKYFDGKSLTKEKLPELVELNTDCYFKVSAKNLVDNRRKRKCAPTYLYQYSYVGSEGTSTDRLVEGNRPVAGASHVDEIPYLFYSPPLKENNPDPPAPGSKDRITMERLTRLWTNFAKTGDPTSRLDEYVDVVWKPATEDECPCFDIGDNLRLSPVESDVRAYK